MNLYFFFSVQEEYFARIGLSLKARGIATRLSGCVWGLHSERMLSEFGLRSDDFLRLSKVFRDLPKNVDLDYLQSWEDPSLPVTIPLMLTADRVICNLSYESGLRHAEALFRATEAAFLKLRPDCIVMDAVSCLPSYVHFLVAKRHNIPLLSLELSRLSDHILIHSDAFGRLEELNAEYSTIQQSGLSLQEREHARQIIRNTVGQTGRGSQMSFMKMAPGFQWHDLHTLALVVARRWRDRYDYIAIRPVQALVTRLRRLVRSLFAQRLWQNPVAGEKYVLFPLHYQPEASTSVRAPWYIDQAGLIASIARALPAGYRLYVKEHGFRLGGRPDAELRQIAAVPGVRLVPPGSDTHRLIGNAACVATITGTMGWEALLMNVPVVVFGDVFYAPCHSVFRAQEPRAYPSVFNCAISSAPDSQDVENFVAALARVCRPGAMGHAYYRPDVLSERNINQVAAALADRLPPTPLVNATRVRNSPVPVT